ncbi:MAG TPA: hypothetical protein PLK58_04485 [Candidatus Rifleibacterium sp.]|nr:hypothetical protein [Candidatus Ozemobacteraceae bacterium]HPW57870.1 hypothetical protein [Candidatus Rifleibacterium sp.]
MLKNYLYLTAFLLLSAGQIFADPQKFPSWMEEVELRKPAAQNSFNEPTAPIDPATGQPSTNSKGPGAAFGKPKLPDFSKLREKAIKAEFEKRAAAEGELENSYSASVKNIDQLKSEKSRLETLLAAGPGDNERQQLLAGIGGLAQKIALSEELIKLLSQSGDPNAKIPVASLSSAQFDRAIEIKKLLFPGSHKAAPLPFKAPTKATKAVESEPQAVDHDREPTEEELIKARQYKPGRIKSFYKEMKQAEQQKQEKDEE